MTGDDSGWVQGMMEHHRMQKNPQDNTPAAAAAALRDMPIVSPFSLRRAALFVSTVFGRFQRHENSRSGTLSHRNMFCTVTP